MRMFQRIVSLFGKPNIDLFASRLNAQVESYVSWRLRQAGIDIEWLSGLSALQLVRPCCLFLLM